MNKNVAVKVAIYRATLALNIQKIRVYNSHHFTNSLADQPKWFLSVFRHINCDKRIMLLLPYSQSVQTRTRYSTAVIRRNYACFSQSWYQCVKFHCNTFNFERYTLINTKWIALPRSTITAVSAIAKLDSLYLVESISYRLTDGNGKITR